jgi:hypothetical protein
MSAEIFQQSTCAACGAVSNQIVLPFSPPIPATAPPDFDTRPGEPVRSTLLEWVQYCPECGYAVDDISEIAEGVREIVSSAEYRQLVGDSSLPAQARPFLGYARILERLQAFPDAGWCAMHAAWVCDDRLEDAAAIRCRERAILLWRTGKELGSGFMDSQAEEFAVVADVYRRIGQFEEARNACNAALDGPELPAGIDAMLRRQLVLIARGDRSAHSVEEIDAPPGQRARVEL